MAWITLFSSLLLGGSAFAGEKQERSLTFSKKDLGKVPTGWMTTRTNVGKGSIWKVVEDKTAPAKTGCALAQVAEGDRRVLNLCVAEGTRFKDGEISVQFKAIKGLVDQGGGIVWRYQNAENYYIARMNPLEKNLRLYVVVGGKRNQIATTQNDVVVLPGTWRKVTIRHVGDRIQCFLDDMKLLDVKDNTFAQPGQVGLWTKADAHTYFDQFVVRAVKGKKD